MADSRATTSDDWWRNAVVYQIYPRSFADGNGDGVGDLRGIIDRLDHIESLGVDAVWLSPIYRSPMRDFGYDVADYCDVDPVFGTLDDVDELIDDLHGRGMRLLLDWVPNHTSSDHPWFVESRSSRHNPKRDWYVWRDPLPDGSPPTNWMATFNGVPAWTFDEHTEQSWLHLFLPDQPDLNWANPDVESAMHDTLRFWLDRGVDGFRSDVVNLIGKGTDVDDLPPNLASVALLATDRPFGHELLRRIRRLLDAYEHDPMMVGEVYLLRSGESASYLGTDDEPELHLSFDFRSVHTEWEPERLHGTISAIQSDFSSPRWPTWVLSNHDQPRHRTRYGSDDHARAAAVMSLTMRGTPFLYAGEELGLTDGDVPAERVVDPDGRDGCRAPIPWLADGDDETGHGWGDHPWLPFPTNASTHATDVQQSDPQSILRLYRRLLELRRATPALHCGSMELEPLEDELLRWTRSHDGDRWTIVVNTGTSPAEWPADIDAADATITSYAEGSVADTIRPLEAVVLHG